ncbi:hypothetical protein R6Z07F_018111 [Ovis aries]
MDGRARGRSGGGGRGRAGRVPAAGLRAERAGPGRRARSHPRRGPRAQRRELGGPARGPRSMLPPPRRRGAAGGRSSGRLCGRCPAPSSASRESRSATFSPPRSRRVPRPAPGPGRAPPPRPRSGLIRTTLQGSERSAREGEVPAPAAGRRAAPRTPRAAAGCGPRQSRDARVPSPPPSPF